MLAISATSKSLEATISFADKLKLVNIIQTSVRNEFLNDRQNLRIYLDLFQENDDMLEASSACCSPEHVGKT